MLTIRQKLINFNYSPRSVPIKYIVIHDVGTKGSTAIDNYIYFNGADRQSSADFFVDADNIIQLADYNKDYSWHCGDGKGKYGITNNNSIGIEMCLVEPFDKVVDNTIELVKYLMKELNIPIDNVVRHYDASRKNCPGSLSADDWAKWYEFKNRLIDSGPSITDCTNELKWRGIITAQELWNVKAEQDIDIKFMLSKYYPYILKNGGSVKDRKISCDDALDILQKQGIVSDYALWNDKAFVDREIYQLIINMADYIN